MPVQKASHLVGVAKQAAKGALMANPMFVHGVTDGGLASANPKQSALEVTSGKRTRANVVRESVANGGDIKAPAYLKALGLYLLGALGGDVVTGTGPFVHTFSTADTLPYLSLFEKFGGVMTAVRDAKIEELTLSWDGRKPLVLSIKALGTVFSYPLTFVGTTDETGSDSFLIPVGGVFQYDVDGSVLATARVNKGELSVKNVVDAVELSASIEADDMFEGLQEHSVKLTIVPDDLNDYRTALTGSPAGATSAVVPPLGGFSLLFKENGGTGQLLVTAAKVAFDIAWPKGDSKGGAVELELVGLPVGNAPVVYALTNQQATY